jgi:hypothetical protein
MYRVMQNSIDLHFNWARPLYLQLTVILQARHEGKKEEENLQI